MQRRLGGHAVVQQLLLHGVDHAFCVPGESYLPVLDGLYDVQDSLRLITHRHEGAAAMAAAAYGRLTGKPGVCLVTRGPGATNASIGVHVASQDASPMVLLVGQVATSELGHRSFQEVDYRSMFADLAKDVLEVQSVDRIPEIISRAFATAQAGEPGPVVVSLPQDILYASTEAPLVKPAEQVTPRPSLDDLEQFMDMVGRAERPVFVVGGSRWNAAATVSIRRFAESHGIPIATAARNQDLVDNTSEVFVGTLGLGTTPGLGDLMKEADLVALIGTRPDALTTEDSSWLTSPRPTQRLVHVHPDPNVLNKVFASDLSIVSCPSSFAAALISQRAAFAPDAWLARLRENRGMVPSSTPNQTDPAAFMNVLNARLPQNAIMTAGAGAYTSWHQRYRTYSTYPSQVATQSGSMGYGLPAAIAAKLVHPERAVVAFGGDGCFLMTGVELATAARYRLAITVIVINNSRYGTIRAHQDANFPGRVSGTDLVNPHFAQFARSFGLPAETVRTPREFESALGRLLGRNEPTLIEIVVP